MSQPATDAAPVAGDPVVDVAAAAVKVLAGAVVVAVLLPLLVPMVVLAALPPGAATKTRFWIVPPGWLPVVVLGPVAVLALLAVEAVGLSDRVAARVVSWSGLPGLWEQVWPWLLVNTAAGVLLVPAVFAVRRRRVARQVRDRRTPDVVVQERIETARKHAADLTAARRVGVRLHPGTGQVRQVRADALCAPHPVGDVVAVGVVSRPTVQTLTERLRDRRQVRDWTSRDGRWVQLPSDAGSARALLVAESGSGKTVLLHGLVRCALHRGWPVVFIDAKGDPGDASALAAAAAAAGRTVRVAAEWDCFTGSAAQTVETLMRLLPAPDGANQHYLDEARAVLAAIQGRSPVRSVAELLQRLTDPVPHLRDDRDRDLVTTIVEARTNLTAAGRVQRAVSAALRPLETRLAATGSSYRSLDVDLTIVPLSPADAAQARLGDLMLTDLRHALTDRLTAGDRSPLLVVVDEFAQLVGTDTDPGDTAAALFETARSAGVGLVLAVQSTAGLSHDQARRARALASGAALLLGRSKDPEDLVKHAGTVMQMEASGAAAGEELRSARAQHTFVIPPQDVREAWDGAFWLVQGGAIATFRALPAPPTPTGPAGHPQPAPAADPPPQPTELAPPPDTAAAAAITLQPVAGPARPTARVARPTGVRSPAPPVQPDAPITGLELEVVHHGAGSWLATAYPATDTLVLNDLPDLDHVAFLADTHPAGAASGTWRGQWHPDQPHDWAEPGTPPAWLDPLQRLIDRSRSRWQL